MKQDVIMHDTDRKLHFYSGLGAFIIYFLVLLLVLGGFHFYKERVRYGEIEPSNAVVELEGIELDNVNEQEKNTESNITQPIQDSKQDTKIEKVQEAPKDLLTPQTKESAKQPPKASQKEIQEAKPEEKELDLADMFSNISSETMQDRKAKQEAQRQEEILLRKKQQEEAKKQQAQQLAQNAAAIEQSTRALQQSAKNLQENVKQVVASKANLEKPKFVGNSKDKAKYDEWYANIEQILMNEWKKSPKFYQSSTTAKVRITIDSNGRLKYMYMIQQSPYGEYNNSVVEFLKQMEKRAFPPPPGDGFGESIHTNLELENTLRHE